MSVLGLKLGYGKIRPEPLELPLGLGHILPCIPPLVLIRIQYTHIRFKVVFIHQNNRWNMAVNSRYLQSGQKSWLKTNPKERNPNHFFMFQMRA